MAIHLITSTRATLSVVHTLNGVPVYNVARPLLLRTRPDLPPFRLFELPREAAPLQPGA